MGCSGIHDSWTASTLAGAFLDLALAYLLLCGSAVAFILSKSLSVFGLSLPCPCRGLFGCPHGAPCLHRLLVDSPTNRIAAVQLSARTNFPYNSFWLDGGCDRHVDVQHPDGNGDSSRREESCGSVPKLHGLHWADKAIETDVQDQTGLRHRRGRHSSCEDGVESNEITFVPMELENKVIESDDRARRGNSEDHLNTIANLERALEKEQASREALYVELEKERSATATSVDEAMAMILRLQEEKAAFEMEARHYQRVNEEKSAYYEEEMAILKEIIVRRETEKHMLEKEVESLRCLLLSGSSLRHHPNSDMHGQSIFDSSDDPILLPHNLRDSAGNEVEEKNKEEMHKLTGKGRSVISDLDSSTAFMEEMEKLNCVRRQSLKNPNFEDESLIEFQEKSVVTTDIYPSTAQKQMSTCQKYSRQTDEPGKNGGHSKVGRIGKIDHNDQVFNHKVNRKEYATHHTGVGLGFHELHVAKDKLLLEAIANNQESKHCQLGGLMDVHEKGYEMPTSSRNFISNSMDYSAAESVGVEQSIHRSCSEVTKETILKNRLLDKSSLPDVRRNSMSSLDGERFKLESEVEILRRRLKLVQEGRQKLNLTVENREKGSLQVQPPQESVESMGSKRSVHDGYLPPLSMKVKSNKRRCSSVPLELNRR